MFMTCIYYIYMIYTYEYCLFSLNQWHTILNDKGFLSTTGRWELLKTGSMLCNMNKKTVDECYLFWDVPSGFFGMKSNVLVFDLRPSPEPSTQMYMAWICKEENIVRTLKQLIVISRQTSWSQENVPCTKQITCLTNEQIYIHIKKNSLKGTKSAS